MKRIGLIKPALLLTLAIPLACSELVDQVEERAQTVKLTLIDVSVHEVYIHIARLETKPNTVYLLTRNGYTVRELLDTELGQNLTDTGLVANTMYEYTIISSANPRVIESNIVQARTLTPSGHTVTWETFFLGEGSGSIAYDVEVVSESLIVAVGEFYLRDSTTGEFESERYNLARFVDGKFTLDKVYYYYAGSAWNSQLNSIFSRSPGDIWVASNQPLAGDGHNWRQFTLTMFTSWANEMSGGDSNHVYMVGNGGNMAFYDGSTWSKVETQSQFNMLDVWCVVNLVTGVEEAWSPATGFPDAPSNQVLKMTRGIVVDRISNVVPDDQVLFSLWTNKGFPLYVCGDGIHENSRGRWREVAQNMAPSANRIRGTALNDIFAVTGFGAVVHYDGETWTSFPEVFNASYFSLSVKARTIAVCGTVAQKGIVTIGRRP